MCHSDTVHRAAAVFPCGDRPDRFPIRTRFFGDCDIVQVIQLYNYVMDRPATIFRIVFKAAPICIFSCWCSFSIYLWQFCTGKTG